MAAKNKLGYRVMFFRQREDMSQLELAKKVNMSQSVIAQIESGRSNPSLGTLKKIAKALNVPEAWFFVEKLEVEI